MAGVFLAAAYTIYNRMKAGKYILKSDNLLDIDCTLLEEIPIITVEEHDNFSEDKVGESFGREGVKHHEDQQKNPIQEALVNDAQLRNTLNIQPSTRLSSASSDSIISIDSSAASSLNIFSEVEANSMTSLTSSKHNILLTKQERLRKTIKNLTTADDLTEKRIGIILDSHNEFYEEPWLFKLMVKKANFLVCSESYMEIIQKMVNRFKEHTNNFNESLLNVMLGQLNEPGAMESFANYQDNFLHIIQVLLSVENGEQSRRQCFWLLFRNTMHKKLDWMKKLIEVLKELLEDSPNLSWVPENEEGSWGKQTVLYTVFQCMPIILSIHQRTVSELLPLLLSEKYLHQTEENGNVLHALVNADWRMLGPNCMSPAWVPFKEFIDMTVNAMPDLCNTTDANEMTPIQCFFKQIIRFQPATLPKEIIESLQSNSNFKKRDKNGNTVLHLASEALYKCQNSRSELMDIIPSLISKENVNAQNNLKETPYTWILIGRLQFEDKFTEEYVYFSKMGQIFEEKNADDMLAKAGSAAPMFEWVGKELRNEKCTNDRLQNLLCHMRYVKNLKYIQMNEDLEVLEYLCFVKNATLLSPMKQIIRIMVKIEKVRKQIVDLMLLFPYQITPLTVMELLSICAEERNKLSPGQEQSYCKWITSISKCAELPVNSLRMLNFGKREKLCNLDINFLAEPYKCSRDLIRLARKLTRSQYVEFQECIDSKQLINCLTFNAKEGETKIKLQESYFLESENWLKRSSLHLAAIFLETFASLSQNMIKKYIHTKDLHGCTPLHIAYLCQNEPAVNFLTSIGAKKDAIDLFGATPQSLGDREKQPQLASHYETLCRAVIDNDDNTFLDIIKPMIFMEEGEARTLQDETIALFERLVKETTFKEAKVVMAGSMREKTKVGWLDEVDVQLQIKGPYSKVTIAGETYTPDQLVKTLSGELIGSLAKISWEGIYLRPISVTGPWEFIREGPSLTAGTVVSVDIVPVIVTSYVNEEDYKCQENILKGAPKHLEKYYITLQPWNSRFAYEWDIMDNLPTSCRLAILIAKSLVQAYHQTRPEKLEVKMPITSYTIKTALIYLLAYDSSELVGLSTHKTMNDTLKKVYDELEQNISKWRNIKLEYDPEKRVRWMTAQDFDQHQEEAIAWVSMIFHLIKYLAEEKFELTSFWDRAHPVREIVPYASGIGKDGYIVDICEVVLGKLPM